MVMAGAAVLFVQLPVSANADAMSVTKDTLLDRVQIEDMMVEYYTTLSLADHTGLQKYFAKNAEMVLNDQTLKGRDAIQKFYDGTLDPRIEPGKFYNMMLGNPRISIKGNAAVMDAIWTGILSDSVKAPPRLIEQGTEHSEFIKQDGRWLISKRVIVSESGLP